MQILVDKTSGAILAYGSFNATSDTTSVFDVPDASIATLSQAGNKTWTNGVIAVNPPAPLSVAADPPPNIKRALQALATSNLDAATKQQIADALKGI